MELRTTLHWQSAQLLNFWHRNFYLILLLIQPLSLLMGYSINGIMFLVYTRALDEYISKLSTYSDLTGPLFLLTLLLVLGNLRHIQ
jgi:nitrate reductase gamma subunit